MESQKVQVAAAENRWQKILAQTFLLFLLCLILALLDGFKSYVSAYHQGIFYLDLILALRWDLSGWMIWMLFIPIIFRLSQRFSINRQNWVKYGLLIFLPLGLAFALLRTIFPMVVSLLFFESFQNLIHWVPIKFFVFISDFSVALFFYALVLTFGQAINYYKKLRLEEIRTSQLEAQLSKAQLAALKMQLHPHFLFNTLNSISALQLENTEAAQEMMARLGDFLRLTLDNIGTQEVTLQREIEFLQCYLDIEQVRFGKRLTTQIEVSPDVLNCRVPNLILQPLVENAIKHGISAQIKSGKLTISAVRENDWLKIEVADNGQGIKSDDLEKAFSSGLGLENIKARLRQFYDANFDFNLKNISGGGLLVTLRLPHKLAAGSEVLS